MEYLRGWYVRMNQKKDNVYSVGQICTYIKNLLVQDFLLSRIGVRGEISNCKYHSSGHIYFSLKDAQGSIPCVMFAGDRVRGLSFRLADGMQAVVYGSVGYYERDGRCQLYAKRIEQDGAGALYERFLALKQELEEMGMFSPEYKKPIPSYVKTLGVVTAPTGAAVRDIINIARRRNPGIRILLYPAQVQGAGAAQSIAEGLAALDCVHPDVIIVGRGGGSIEDLWAFNEELTARAIFSCETPVISAVGHETDTTIADYVSDLRAPTPSAAAELAVCDIQVYLEKLEQIRRRFMFCMEEKIRQAHQKAELAARRLQVVSPANQLASNRQYAADLSDRLRQAMQRVLEAKRHQLGIRAQRLQGLSPLDRLSAGYAYLSDEQERRITRASQAVLGRNMQIWLSDGRILARTVDISLSEDLDPRKEKDSVQKGWGADADE